MVKKAKEFIGFCSQAAIALIKFFIKYAVSEILFYGYLAIAGLGLAFVFHSWGLSDNIALGLGSIVAIIALALIMTIINYYWQKNKQRDSKSVTSDVLLARWLANGLQKQTAREWEEYQDWLHDILLARDRLLASNCPLWKVALITYWRLLGFCLIISYLKLKNIAIAFVKWR